MKRVADYIVESLYNLGVEHTFFVPGSGCMFLIDALARHKTMTAINMNHEQSASMAAIAYSQATNNLGACIVTTGCGGTNAITGLLHAWQDNIPCVFVSGQAERNHTIRNSEVPLRQFGRQETDIISIVSPITKYAVMLNDPKDVVYEFEKAINIAMSGRKGPVWIDVPLDIQSSIIDEVDTNHYLEKDILPAVTFDDLDYVRKALNNAKRPIFLVGNGVKLANAKKIFNDLVHRLNIPVVHSRLGSDIIPTDDDLSIGMIGMLAASRSGNFAVQNSDCVVSIGSRLSINTTSYDYHNFVREGKLIVIDIDEVEHKKNTVKIDHFIKADAYSFIEGLLKVDLDTNFDEWAAKCLHWKQTMPILLDDYKNRDQIDMYHLAEELSKVMDDDAIVVSDAGDGYYVGTCGIHYTYNQLCIGSAGQAEMGFALPGAIGAQFAKDKQVICFVGDGSFMMNLQELATVAHYQLPIKIILINNNGYSCIRKLHKGSFRRYVGCDPSQGLGMPNFKKIASAFEIDYVCIEGSNELGARIKTVLDANGPIICEVMCTEEQQFLSVTNRLNKNRKFVSTPLEDQSPFISEEILNQEMIIKVLD